MNSRCGKKSIRKSTIWVWVKEGKFTKPIKLSEHISAWKESDIDEWIDGKID